MLLIAALLACAGTPEPAAPPAATSTPAATPAATPSTEAPVALAVRNVSVQALKADQDAAKVPVLWDVRSPEEFASGHVPGAKNVPLDQVGSRMGELAAYKEGEVYLICQAGGRSARAAQTLASAGYHAVNVEGGTGAWIAAGLPVEK